MRNVYICRQFVSKFNKQFSCKLHQFYLSRMVKEKTQKDDHFFPFLCGCMRFVNVKWNFQYFLLCSLLLLIQRKMEHTKNATNIFFQFKERIKKTILLSGSRHCDINRKKNVFVFFSLFRRNAFPIYVFDTFTRRKYKMWCVKRNRGQH